MDIITLKTQENRINNNTDNPEAVDVRTQRTIVVVNTVVIVNAHITISTTVETLPTLEIFNLNVVQLHQTLFEAMKLIDFTLK